MYVEIIDRFRDFGLLAATTFRAIHESKLAQPLQSYKSKVVYVSQEQHNYLARSFRRRESRSAVMIFSDLCCQPPLLLRRSVPSSFAAGSIEDSSAMSWRSTARSADLSSSRLQASKIAGAHLRRCPIADCAVCRALTGSVELADCQAAKF